MVYLIIAAVILIIIMLIFAFILFKNIIKRIDDNAKKYFVNKMQDYDYILEEKQTKLEKIQKEIEYAKKTNENILKKDEEDEKIVKKAEKHEEDDDEPEIHKKKEVIKYNLNVPEYRETQFFSNYKEIKKIFTINNEKVIKDFVLKNKNAKEEKMYKSLLNIREQFTEDAIYGLLTLSTEDQIGILSKILKQSEKKLVDFESISNKKNFNIKDLLKVVDKKIEELEPTIYIYVNGTSCNFDYIDKNIVTKQYKNMSEGIIIKYRNKIYDYSI